MGGIGEREMTMPEDNKQITLNGAMYEHGVLVRDIGYQLEDLAGAAHALGQDRLSDHLSKFGNLLNESFEALSRAHNEAVHDNMLRANDATTNMLRAAIAGIELGSVSP
jgi:hypothetical protein